MLLRREHRARTINDIACPPSAARWHVRYSADISRVALPASITQIMLEIGARRRRISVLLTGLGRSPKYHRHDEVLGNAGVSLVLSAVMSRVASRQQRFLAALGRSIIWSQRRSQLAVINVFDGVAAKLLAGGCGERHVLPSVKPTSRRRPITVGMLSDIPCGPQRSSRRWVMACCDTCSYAAKSIPTVSSVMQPLQHNPAR